MTLPKDAGGVVRWVCQIGTDFKVAIKLLLFENSGNTSGDSSHKLQWVRENYTNS